MGTRIHPQPGEPFCDACHLGNDESCSQEHSDWCATGNTKMETGMIDRLFLELAQVTKAQTPEQIRLRTENERLRDALAFIVRRCDADDDARASRTQT